MSRSTVRNSKRLSWLLRHGAHEAGIAMDPAGWVSVDDALRALDLSRDQLLAAVVTNDKGRLELAGDQIRACQGHSLGTLPVTCDALEASWQRIHPAESLWHGTGMHAVAGIAATGIEPGSRSHVHLAPRPDSHVGKRAAVDLLLEVSPDRLRHADVAIFVAPNGVVLVRHVPLACICGVRAVTDAGRAALTATRTQLGLHDVP